MGIGEEMKRRNFLKAAIAATAMPLLPGSVQGGGNFHGVLHSVPWEDWTIYDGMYDLAAGNIIPPRIGNCRCSYAGQGLSQTYK